MSIIFQSNLKKREMQRTQRLTKELAKITQNPPSGISLSPLNDNLDYFQASLVGPNGTPYEQAVFNLEIVIPQNYPFSPPSVKFKTKIYHPNIDDTGRICLDLLKMPPKGCWKPTIGLEGLLIAIRMLLEHPNPEDPLMIEIAEEFKNNYSQFISVAREYSKQYAIKHS
ncbi:ubiquitin-conjugating enzyme E2 T-like [Agrilus planipennis]|uniref:Ubiquitin-conjugating enzyme E2 T n=1 Tax=Agrilus planipennis TaxID=224129 RepID=A0A1W4WY07_AGRPL|nr:ubiquitin-conjugating enzyme E2 T-like [Agrilus planipennis]